jgi:plastocyanin
MGMTTRRIAAFVVLPALMALVLAVAGCGGGGYGSNGSSSSATTSKATAAASSNPASPMAVQIKGFAFGPQTLTVKSGSKVTFTNEESTNHTATATGGGSFDTGTISPGASKTVTLDSPGTFAYVCSFHPFMHGTIRVTG